MWGKVVMGEGSLKLRGGRGSLSPRAVGRRRIGALVAEISASLQDCLPRDPHFREELESSLDWATLERPGTEPLAFFRGISETF